MFCSQCGAQMNPTDTFCARCGAAMEPEQARSSHCSKCGFDLEAGDTFCPHCGTPVSSGKANSPAGQTTNARGAAPREMPTSALDTERQSGEMPTSMLDSSSVQQEMPTGMLADSGEGEAPTSMFEDGSATGELPTTMLGDEPDKEQTGELEAAFATVVDEDDSDTSLLESVPCVLQNTVSGAVIELDSFPFVIGKGENTNCCIEGNDAISNAHAQIDCVQGLYRVTDLHSKNGTSLNGHVLNPCDPATIVFGSLICIANEEFMFERADQAKEQAEEGNVAQSTEHSAAQSADGMVVPGDTSVDANALSFLEEIIGMEYPEYGVLLSSAEDGESLASVLVQAWDGDGSADKQGFKQLCDEMVRTIAGK